MVFSSRKYGMLSVLTAKKRNLFFLHSDNIDSRGLAQNKVFLRLNITKIEKFCVEGTFMIYEEENGKYKNRS